MTTKKAYIESTLTRRLSELENEYYSIVEYDIHKVDFAMAKMVKFAKAYKRKLITKTEYNIMRNACEKFMFK